MHRLARMAAAVTFLMIVVGVCPLAPGQNKAPQRTPGVLFAGKELPLPPQTGKDWKVPDTKFSATWGTAVQQLMKYGFADPRGCEYREVEITCGTITSNKGFLLSTHAWVLPQPASTSSDAQRFAVTWSGLVYPVVTIGAPADLRSDAEALRKLPPEQFEYHAYPEESLASHEHLDSLKCCMLLVLGEVDLAEKIWRITKPTFDAGRRQNPADQRDDPYLGLVHIWAFAHFDRAVCARLRGDDVLSLASARIFVSLRDSVEIDAPKRGFVHQQSFHGEHPQFLRFLAPLEIILKDQSRRVAALPVARVLGPGATPIADPAARIAALIQNLELVDTWTGHHSPIVRALIAEGLPAVEPLLECMEKDERLTRSVIYRNQDFPERSFLAVNKVARTTVEEILKQQHFGPKTDSKVFYETWLDKKIRDATVKELRDLYNQAKGRTETEWWYLILSDPQATDREWLEAALNITARSNQSNVQQQLPFQGELLRNHADPSVSVLLAKRADQISTLDRDNSRRIHNLQVACTLTLCLSKWDIKAALPEIHKRVEQCRLLNLDRSFHRYTPALHDSFSKLIVVAVDNGATEVIDDYVAWVKTLTPDPGGPLFEMSIFRPLTRYADHPKMVKLAEALFSPRSAWLPLQERVGVRWHHWVTSPLVGTSAFRELLKSQLDDQTPFGTMTLDPANQSVRLKIGDGSMSQRMNTAFDPNEPGLLEPKVVRLCDFYAWKLSDLQGAPHYELWWPEAKRNAVLPRVKKFLDQWGNAFRDRGPVYEEFAGPAYRAIFCIAQSDHLATEAEVASGLAIFSLDTPSEGGRTVALKSFPQPARWKTLTDFPIQKDGPADPATGKPTRVKSFDQEGSIWQAEEVMVDGQWKRYYGFVGRHIIAKVPTEEIEFIEHPQ